MSYVNVVVMERWSALRLMLNILCLVLQVLVLSSVSQIKFRFLSQVEIVWLRMNGGRILMTNAILFVKESDN